ncbi:hypothetical protein CTAYLR_005675 [Chrysophaeum taylorii]|uniref:FH2 domain-containing protein n=1 Tax=Chrysophaeum taylorii TaxID=2483200 RepID=A0AAD7UMX9_9STRA|nr:hypothetical protein CTAYLR_005675 [Chrysophaeum taylorii]
MDGRAALLAELEKKRAVVTPGPPGPTIVSPRVRVRTPPTTPGSPIHAASARDAALKARRRSMTPDDKESLLKSEDKVIGAALSLHVIHDVSLSDLDARLAAWGVEDQLRARALETIRNKTHALIRKKTSPPQKKRLSFEENEARRMVGAPRINEKKSDGLDKYRRMLSVGVPEAAVLAAAKRDGVNASALCGGSEEEEEEEEKKKGPPAEEKKDELAAYRKMVSLGVPAAAVRARMARERRSEAEMDAVAPGGDVPKPKVTPKRRVKALHWEKLEEDKIDVSLTVWVEPSELNLVEDDDLALLEEMFATVPKALKKKKNSESSSSSLKKISLLKDARRASNVAIGLTYFSKRFGDDDSATCRAVLGLDEWFDAPRLRSLQALLPTPDEVAAVRGYKGDPEKLARPERFFRATLPFPELGSRIDIGIFRAEYDEVAWEARHAAKTVQAACDSLRDSAGLALVLRSLLKFGNALNAGLSCGEAKGVSIASLDRVATAKANDGSSLLDFLAGVLAKKNQVSLLDFVDDIPNLADAARGADESNTSTAHRRLAHQLAATKADLDKATRRLRDIDPASLDLERNAMACEDKKPARRREHELLGAEKATTTRFVREAKRCCAAAETVIASLDHQLRRLAKAKKDLCTYFGETGADVRDVFKALDVFVAQVKRARDKQRRQIEAKKRQEDRLLKKAHRAKSLSSIDDADDADVAAKKKKQPLRSASGASDLKPSLTLSLSKVRTAYNQKESKKREYSLFMAQIDEMPPTPGSIADDYYDDLDSADKALLPPAGVPSPRTLHKLQPPPGDKENHPSRLAHHLAARRPKSTPSSSSSSSSSTWWTSKLF